MRKLPYSNEFINTVLPLEILSEPTSQSIFQKPSQESRNEQSSLSCKSSRVPWLRSQRPCDITRRTFQLWRRESGQSFCSEKPKDLLQTNSKKFAGPARLTLRFALNALGNQALAIIKIQDGRIFKISCI